jgi:hypothetical protein
VPLNETPTTNELIGAGLIFVASALGTIKRKSEILIGDLS